MDDNNGDFNEIDDEGDIEDIEDNDDKKRRKKMKRVVTVTVIPVQDSVFNQTYCFESDVIDLESYFKDYGELIKSSLKFEPEKFHYRKNSEQQLGDKNQNEFSVLQSSHDFIESEKEIYTTNLNGTCKTRLKRSLSRPKSYYQKKSKKQLKENENELYKSQLDINDEELKILMNIASPDNLICEGELEACSLDESNFEVKIASKPLPISNLEIFKKVLEEEEEEDKDKFNLKQADYTILPTCKNPRLKIDLNPLELKQIVICVKIYRPFLSTKNIPARVQLLQEIHLLQDQYLYDLKDKIQCNVDHMEVRDVSEDFFLKEVELKTTAKNLYPSSFMFIEDTFYNDSRVDPGNNCQTIKEWLEKRGLGPFKMSSMNEKPLAKIPLKIGHPYVYQHQGSCEHIIIFSDIRFLNSCDPSRSRCFPNVHAVGKSRVQKCRMCADSFANMMDCQLL